MKTQNHETDVEEQETATATSLSQGGKHTGKKAGAAPDKDEAMKRMQAAGTPGPEHKALDALTGDWKAEAKCYMEAEGEPQVSHATASVSWILGGRFLEEDFHGEMMGKPFTGRCLLGYDNTKKKYKCVWMDDMSTAIFTSEGTGDNKTITLEGKGDCPATGRKDVPMKQVYRIVGPNEHTLEMFNDGKKTMEVKYTRP